MGKHEPLCQVTPSPVVPPEEPGDEAQNPCDMNHEILVD